MTWLPNHCHCDLDIFVGYLIGLLAKGHLSISNSCEGSLIPLGFDFPRKTMGWICCTQRDIYRIYGYKNRYTFKKTCQEDDGLDIQDMLDSLDCRDVSGDIQECRRYVST